MNDTAAGFEEAFDELFPRAFRLARRMLGDAVLAENIAAKALARAALDGSLAAGGEVVDDEEQHVDDAPLPPASRRR